MKIIDAKNCVAGRIASYVAKESLKGEEIVVVNCENAILTGGKKNIKKEYTTKRQRLGPGLRGPKYPKTSERVLKRTIRGMLPEHRFGKGKEAFKRIRCYNGFPKEFERKEVIQISKVKTDKYARVKDISR